MIAPLAGALLSGFVAAADAAPIRAGSSHADTAGAWQAEVLGLAPGVVIIAAGSSDGLHTGDCLRVVRPGPRISPRENLVLELPGDSIARIEVLTPFVTPRGREGTACVLVSGDSVALTDRVERSAP